VLDSYASASMPSFSRDLGGFAATPDRTPTLFELAQTNPKAYEHMYGKPGTVAPVSAVPMDDIETMLDHVKSGKYSLTPNW
jgi:hypothetical protein